MLDLATIINTAIGCFIAIWIFLAINMVVAVFVLADKNDLPEVYLKLNTTQKILFYVLMILTGPFQIWDDWEYSKKK